ncbi:MAG: diacylglycerol kinase family protein [Candidatus Daviesbacteria bacterium]|nr:diacylglycerol kinase family protein [Candidatus Daviesbacteria bacterium]
MHEKIGIYVNPIVPQRYQRYAVELSEQLPKNTLHKLTFPLLSIPDEETTIIIIGGDGSIKETTKALLKKDNPGLLLIVPAGSQNGFFHALRDKKTLVSMDQIRDGATDHIPLYKPGIINNEPFNHLADLTKAGALQQKYSEALRSYIPRRLRALTGVAIGFAKIKTGPDYPSYDFKMLMPSPYIGPLKIFPEQDLYGDTVTLVTMDAKSKAEGVLKTTLVLLYLINHKHPPTSLVKIETQRSFTVADHYPEINMDGESMSIPKKDSVFVSRSKKSLQIATLI